MRWALLSLTSLMILGCSGPMAHIADYGGTEGWPPTVNEIHPPAAAPGTVVTLEGAYLDDARQVLVEGRPAKFTASAKALAVTLPGDLKPGAAAVVVMVPRGTTAPMSVQIVH